MSGYDLKEVEAEFAAQIERLMEVGITPDHIDGNNHIHVFPGIAEVVARLAKKFGITRIRLPRESFPEWKYYYRSGGPHKMFIANLSRNSGPIFKKWGLRFPDHFFGIQFPLVSHLDSFRSFIRKCPEGTAELMCHPGYYNLPHNKFSTADREQELCTLTHSSVLEDIRNFHVILISFQDI